MISLKSFVAQVPLQRLPHHQCIYFPAIIIDAIQPINKYGNTDCKISNFLPCTDPASQNNTSSSAFSFKTSNPCVNDENNALIATPANVNLRGVVPLFLKN